MCGGGHRLVVGIVGACGQCTKCYCVMYIVEGAIKNSECGLRVFKSNQIKSYFYSPKSQFKNHLTGL